MARVSIGRCDPVKLLYKKVKLTTALTNGAPFTGLFSLGYVGESQDKKPVHVPSKFWFCHLEVNCLKQVFSFSVLQFSLWNVKVKLYNL